LLISPRITQFLEKNFQVSLPEINIYLGTNLKKSVYVKTFDFGVEEILEDDEQKVLAVEREFTFLSLIGKFADYYEISPGISSFIEKNIK